jgi:alpha/beta superfamily hydrolase
MAAGFSFGAMRALECAAAGEADAYLGVAPPLASPDYATVSPVAVPSALIFAGEDELFDPPDAEELQRLLPDLRCQQTVAAAGHLFAGRLAELRGAVRECAGGLLDSF